MSGFIDAVLTGPIWFYIVLVGCAVAAYLAYGIRELTARSAWVALGLFFVWVAASNSWRFIPYPDPTLEPEALTEAWRLWSVYLRETLILAYLAAGTVTAGVAAVFVWGAYTQSMRFTLLTALYAFATFIAQAGTVMERFVCSTNSPDLGMEYLFWAAGERSEACGRLFVEVVGLPEAIGTQVGPLFFPFLTALPPFYVLFAAYRKRKRGV